MTHKRTIRAALLLAIALALCLYFFGCDDDPPTGPVDPEPKDYVVYFWDLTSDLDYFGYHPLTGQIDSFTVPYYATYGITASADGKRLYCRTSTLVGVVDVATLEVITELPYAAHSFAVSPDNQLLAIIDTSVIILSAADYSTIHEIQSLDCRWCTFSADSRMLYCYGGDDSASVVEVNRDMDYEADTVSLPDSLRIVNFLAAADGAKWFAFRITNYNSRFDVYDRASDSTIFEGYLSPSYGDMQLTPDGRYLIFSEMGDLADYDGPPYFTVFDVAQNRIRMLVSTVGIKDGLNPTYMPVGGLAMTPDGRWLVAMGVKRRDFLLFDIQKMEIANYVELVDDTLSSPTCQLTP